ncbi:MAG TPA: hypothetical protein VFD48_17520, partial [Pyrinomonadaceae bacterium]|nr:hypothetical protein [Pyrinomonadaceae bacterium]
MRGKQKLTIWFLGLILGLACLTLYGSSGAAESTQGPFNLIGWDSGRYIQLNWDAAPEPMLGGYNIYRAVNAQDEWQKLNNQVFSSTSFVDHSAPRSGLIFYRVNLVDSAGHEFLSASVVQISRTAVIAELSESGFALSHDHNSIINDLQLLNTTTMSVAQIQMFLSAQGSVLATYSSGGKTAAQRIFDDCQTHGINPQVVLVTLQKEKGLIKSSTGNPNSLAMGWNTSDSTTSDFANQIYFGTRQFRLYYNNLNNYGWSVG